MKNFTCLKHFSIAFFLLLNFSLVVGQEAYYNLPIDSQVNQSNLVVEGKVISKRSFWDANQQNIYTAHTVEVFKIFKGQITSSNIDIITQGGIVGLNAEVVSNSLRLRENDFGLFLLKNNTAPIDGILSTNSIFQSVGEQQSFYKYNLDNDSASNAFQTINGITSGLYDTIVDHTNTGIIELKAFDIDQQILDQKTINANRNLTPAISSFTASENSAGTGSVLTINGSNFGATQGAVGFRDADFGGALFSNTLDSQILSWTDTQIQVEIPQHAGSGNIRVTTAANGSISSANDLPIDFAQINLEFDLGTGNIAYQTQHIDNNGAGGNTWAMNTDFYNSQARAPFELAFETWTCESGVNWELDPSTISSSSVAGDGVNIITFNSLASGLLGQCISRYSGCASGGEIQWYVDEMDIVFNSNVNWNFSENAPSSGEIDFQSVAVHELGHGQQLGHVIDEALIMHFSLGGGESQRDLSNEDLMGASDIMDRSTGSPICGQIEMTVSDCFNANATLSTDDFDIVNTLTMYPNPATDIVSIKNVSSAHIEHVNIYNIEGKQVLTLNNKAASRDIRAINVNTLTQGMYFVNIITDIGSVTKKLMVR